MPEVATRRTTATERKAPGTATQHAGGSHLVHLWIGAPGKLVLVPIAAPFRAVAVPVVQFPPGGSLQAYAMGYEGTFPATAKDPKLKGHLPGGSTGTTAWERDFYIDRRGDKRAHVDFIDQRVKLDKDFVLYYSLSAKDMDLTMLTHR